MNRTTTTKHSYDFSGSIPAHYDTYLGPLFFEPYALEIASRIDPSGVRVALELASGTGRVTKHLRQTLSPKARLIASDISPDMLTIAKEKLRNENIEWQIIDAQELPFENATLDLVVCCFGLMFVPDKVKAFAEVFRVLHPGGVFLFTTWDKLETIGASYLYRTIAKKFLNEPLPESYNLPFSMWDDLVIKQLLSRTGFSNISIEKISKESVSPSAKHAAEGLTQGGAIYNEIKSRDPRAIEEIKVLLEKELSAKYGEAPMVAPMSALIISAAK